MASSTSGWSAPLRWVLVLVLSVGLKSAFAQEFIGYEGKNAVREGDGGAKKTVEGVDFWSEGAPPRKFTLLGDITDRRHKSGLIGMALMASLEKDVAAVAKKNGGDAVILMNSEAETIGAVGNGFAQRNGSTASGFGASVGVQKQNSKFAVVKYIHEAEATPSNPAGSVLSQPAPLAPAPQVDAAGQASSLQ